MLSQGKVIGGDYINSVVTVPTLGGGLTVRSGFKSHKLSPDNVASWDIRPAEQRPSTASAIGQAVAATVVPRFFGRAAAAATGAAIDSKVRPAVQVLVNWSDGKKSLLKLPAAMSTHFELILSDQRAGIAPPTGDQTPA
jgi:hypothetical protein